MDRPLTSRVAIVTGGGRGIGRAIAVGFAKEGAKVAVTARTSRDIEETVAQVRGLGGDAIAIVGDATEEGDVNHAVSETLESYGQLDILVNNAGIDGSMKPLLEVDEKELVDVMNTNVNGPFLFSKSVLPHMLSRHRGNIINVSSSAGLRSSTVRVRSVTYAVSKFALEGLTFVMAASLAGTGVNINALRPGYVKTSLQNSWTAEQLRSHESAYGKPRDPEAVVPVAVYLASLSPGELCGESVSAKEWYKQRGMQW